MPSDRTGAFTAAYAADGPLGELSGRAAGFLGTEQYRHAARADRFLTIDRWQNESPGPGLGRGTASDLEPQVRRRAFAVHILSVHLGLPADPERGRACDVPRAEPS